MRLGDYLSKEQKQQLNKMVSQSKPRRGKGPDKPKPNDKPKKQEDLSFRDIEDLMGTRRDTYKRVNGAVRRK
ncbi:hypothetical protein V7114_20550 [Neobacillus niacini]|uniref:hypothetical protein n=1 Tax=Neobacillus niacini TaxID=86668 RepID=UPI002FFF5970